VGVHLRLALVCCFLVACDGTIGDARHGEPRGTGPGSDNGGDVGVVPGSDDTSGPPEEFVYVPPQDVLELSDAEFLEIPAAALVQASRTECTSPCAVFFDAISNHGWDELETSAFTWVFSDGAVADGFMSAHVFELPEGAAAETFEVTLVVERDGVALARDTKSITVRPATGRTICVAKSGFSGCPSADAADHFTDVRAAWAAIGTHDRILFRRGDTFSEGFQFNATVPGPVQVGAFGDPGAARPLLVQAGGSWRLESQWSLTDLAISGSAIDGKLITLRGAHTLVMRSHLHDAVDGALVSDGDGYDFSTHKFIIDNAVTGISGTNYLAGNYIAVMGNRMERWGTGHHTIRIGGGKHVLIANNELISDVMHNSLTVRGAGSDRPGSDYVLVQGNVMMQQASVHPQNKESNELLQHVIWERNVHVPHESQTSIQHGLLLNGRDMVVRNNIFHQVRRAVVMEEHVLTGACRNVHVYQNTQFVDRDTSSTQWFIIAGSKHTGLIAQNNLAELHADDGGTRFISISGSDAVVGSNYGYTPGRSDLCEEPDGSSICTDPGLENTSDRSSRAFMLPRSDSLAVDAAVDLPVSEDFNGTPRPQGGVPDVGAVERM